MKSLEELKAIRNRQSDTRIAPGEESAKKFNSKENITPDGVFSFFLFPNPEEGFSDA